MKKILVFVLLFIIPIFGTITHASETVSVKVPLDMSPLLGKDTCKPDKGSYKCTIQTGFASASAAIGSIIKYFTFITGLAGVLFIIYNGIKLSMAGLNASFKDEAKKDIQNTLIGLVLLLLSGMILNLIAPWIYQ